MTDKELKNKICDILNKWAERAVLENKFDGASVYSTYNAEKLADALIEAGIGDVETTKKIGAHATAMAVLQAEKAEHRAEVAERALELMARGECTFASPEYYKEQAEKELAEAGKNYD